MLCAVINGPSENDVQKQIDEASKYADILEFRWDCFESLELTFSCKLPMIFTLRSQSQGGDHKAYLKSEETRLTSLLSLLRLKPQMVDIEFDTPKSFIDLLKSLYPDIKIILSYHNFDETPKNLSEILISMKKTKAKYYKIATQANTTIDALRMLNFSKEVGQELIGLCMGELGSITRILNHWTYAYVFENQKITNGQFPLKTLIDQYRFQTLNHDTAIYGLIGDPVSQSMSHITHNACLDHYGLNAVYLKMIIKKNELAAFFKEIKRLNFKGLSVTMPLKEAVIPFLDSIDEKAFLISAVNTIVIHNHHLKGFNTDSIGALLAIEERFLVKNKKILILGAGGSARAIAYEAILRGAEVFLFNRNLERASTLASEFGCQAIVHLQDNFDTIINCTPDELPIDPKIIQKHCLVMDIKSFPQWTKLLMEAQKKECIIVFGYEMFIHQAVKQFELFFPQKKFNRLNLLLKSFFKAI